MFSIDRVFHLTHLVDDHEAMLALYDEVFGARMHWDRRTGPGGVTISLLLVGDLVVSPMTPGEGGAPAPQRFRERFGQHLHSIAWYVNDAADMVEHLAPRGLALKDEYGRPLDGINHEIWTPARKTPTLVEFIDTSLGDIAGSDPRFAPDWSTAYWREEQPLRIQGTACLTCVVEDLAAGTDFFAAGLHGEVIQEIARTPYGTRSVMVQVGPYTVVEVAEPVDAASRAAADLAACGGDMLHACTFLVADATRAAEHLRSHGLRVEEPAPGHVVLDPADSQGTLFRFTDRQVATW